MQTGITGIEDRLGSYAKGALDAAMSRGVLTEAAKQTLTAGMVKLYVDLKVSRGDAVPFLTEAEFLEQQKQAAPPAPPAT